MKHGRGPVKCRRQRRSQASSPKERSFHTGGYCIAGGRTLRVLEVEGVPGLKRHNGLPEVETPEENVEKP